MPEERQLPDAPAGREAPPIMKLVDARRAIAGELFDAVTDGIGIIDLEGKLIDVNSSLLAMFGLKREKIIGRPLAEVLSTLAEPEEVATLMADSARLAAGATIAPTEFRATAADGRQVVLSISHNVIRDPRGKPGYLFGVMRDITDLKRANAELEAAKKDLELRLKDISNLRAFSNGVFEAMQDGVSMVDMDGRVIGVNSSFLAIYGGRREDVVGRLAADALASWPGMAGTDEILTMLKDHLAGQAINPVEVHVRPPDGGHEVVVSVVSDIVKGPDGKPLVLLGIHRDITKQKRAEEALQESERRFRSIFEASLVGIAISDLNRGRLLDCNPRFQQILGYSKQELLDWLGRPSVAHPDDMEETSELLDEMRKGKRDSFSAEKRYRHKNGSTVWVKLEACVLRDGNGNGSLCLNIVEDITERKQAEEDLKESEHRFRSIFEASLIGIAVFDLSGRLLLDCNPRFQQILGYSKQELHAMVPDNFTHPDDPAETHQLRDEMREGKRDSFSTEKAYRHKNGSTVWGKLEVCVLRDGDGNRSLCFIMLEDITERKQAEEAIRYTHRSQSAMNALLHVFLQPVSLEDMLDRAIDYIISLPWLTRQRKGAIFLVEESPDVLVMKVHRSLPRSILRHCARVTFGHCLCGRAAASRDIVFDQGGSSHHHLRYDGMAPHGHYCIPIVHSRQVLGVINLYVEEGHREDEREKAFLQAVADSMAGMIQRKRGENALRQNEGKFRSLVSNIRLGIIRSTPGPEGRFLEVNPAMEMITGYVRDELLQMKVSDLYWYPEQREKALQAAAMGRSSEIVFRRKDGSEIVVLDTKTPVLDEAGQPLYFDGIVEDITERKRIEEELKGLWEKEKRLRQELEETARSRAQFVNVLAHEVKTPLTPVLGSARLLCERLATAPGNSERRLARNIANGAEALESRINELLDLARLQAQGFSLNFDTVDVLPLITEVADGFRLLAETRGITFVVDLPAQLPSIMADSRRLEQVLMNLVNNAIKYSPDGGSIRLSARAQDGAVIIEIWNTGPVITAEEAVHLFQPYYRRETDRDRFPGSGIGLSLCKELVEAHGGRIWAQGGPREGNTFSLAIPLPDTSKGTGSDQAG